MFCPHFFCIKYVTTRTETAWIGRGIQFLNFWIFSPNILWRIRKVSRVDKFIKKKLYMTSITFFSCKSSQYWQHSFKTFVDWKTHSSSSTRIHYSCAFATFWSKPFSCSASSKLLFSHTSNFTVCSTAKFSLI